MDSSEFVNFLYSGSGSRASLVQATASRLVLAVGQAQLEREPGWEEVPDTAAARRAGGVVTAPSAADRTPPGRPGRAK